MRKIDINELSFNPMTMIAGDWFLLTAGDDKRGYNTMTCSWGHLGSIWGHGGGRPTSVVFVRPQRYTKEFMDREELYTISFFSGHKKALGYLGSHSGRDGDKVAQSGLTPVFGEGYTYFAEAKLVFLCRKLYRAPIREEGFFYPETVEDIYPKRDFHDMYIGEIIEAFAAEE